MREAMSLKMNGTSLSCTLHASRSLWSTESVRHSCGAFVAEILDRRLGVYAFPPRLQLYMRILMSAFVSLDLWHLTRRELSDSRFVVHDVRGAAGYSTYIRVMIRIMVCSRHKQASWAMDVVPLRRRAGISRTTYGGRTMSRSTRA